MDLKISGFAASGKVITTTDSYSATGNIIQYGTGNCQLSTGYVIGNLIMRCKTKEDIIQILKESYNPLLLIDIKNNVYEKLEKHLNLKECCRLNQTYESTNGSKMRILIIEISKL